ncbi:18391_t:CDS:2 [Gigaspora margarita]|uniref:18391_t:CDS:1 n=1 Tax=Gigaspora margarita TaxID=4874 RepID=A0ABN7V826_GIGMA|nr:18391_t:CDS:2 [Gigaspora margarita]
MLQIEILNYAVTESNFQHFCSLRIICKKWNTFIPLTVHKAVISMLNSELSPIYDDCTKTFTFLFDNPDDDISEPLNNYKISENWPFPTQHGIELTELDSQSSGGTTKLSVDLLEIQLFEYS